MLEPRRAILVSNATLLLILVFCSPALSEAPLGQMSYEEIPLTITLSREHIEFNVFGPPGLYEAKEPITVSVQPPFGNWVVFCHGEPLRGARGEIPPERMFVSQLLLGTEVDEDGAEKFASMEQPRMVAEGLLSGPELRGVSTVRFRLLTTWEDEPGRYVGAIKFSYFVRP
jgi:hypothetical protein